MITRPDHPDSNLLFDREEFANYFSLIDQYKTSFKQNNDYSAAQSGLLQLTTEYPSYPDAYVALGEISTKFKDHAAAIDYYQRAQQLCPFNANLAYLIALQCERINKQFALQPPYPDLQIENFFNAAKAEREDERSFRNWYHIKLRQILIPLRLINTDKLLREDLDEDSDYSDITLTNGAVVDAYYANKAFAINLHSIAKYYCQKAILKYEHDFISATKCAEIYYQAGETRKSLEEISRLIDKYNYSISYSLRANFYTASNENRLAIADISKCLVLADKSDMDLIKASNENFLTLLEIFEEKNSIDLQTNDNTTIEIMKLHQKITNSSSQYRCAEEIRLLSNILKKYPAKVLAYTVRGDAMQKKGDIDSALLDYSLALWFAFGSQIPEIYFNRSCLNLRRGEFNAAHYNLNNSIYCLQHDNKHHEIDSLLQRFSVQCVTAGNVHLQNGKFYSAEKIFASGILRKPSFKLYLQLAIALGIQEQYAAALSVLETASQMQNISAGMQAEIHKKIRYFAEKKRRQEQHNFYNFKSHEIRNAKINIKFLQPGESYEPPKILVEHLQQSKSQKKSAKKSAKKALSSTHLIRLRLSEEINTFPNAEHKINLLDSEKAIFAIFNAPKADSREKKFNTFITGGWAVDRARQYFFNISLPQQMCDIDMVTDIPELNIEKNCHMLKRIPQVAGLFNGQVGDIQVDVVLRKSLTDLKNDALSRDFLPLYIDENGVIHDPTGVVINQMRDGILKSACRVNEVFKRDPLTILRAIYISTKRNLMMTDLKEQIHIDKKLLIPDEGIELFHPYRFNNLLKKVFSQKNSLKNYDLMQELGIFKILFPEISHYLELESEWIREQMKNTDKFTWPKLEIIYANMIACAVVNQINEILPAQLQKRQAEVALLLGSEISLTQDGLAMLKSDFEDKLIKEISGRIMQNSLLFQNRFINAENLYSILVKSINARRYFQNAKFFQSTSTSSLSSVAATVPRSLPCP